MRTLRCLSVVLACALAAANARAEEPRSDEAMAQALFDEAKALTDAGKWAEACPKLEESQRLAPGIGTKFRLADCYEHTGRLASAWAAFIDVAGQTRAKGQHEREQVARDRAAALEPKLSRLVIAVPPAARVEGLVVKRDGVVVGEASWGVPVPVDEGARVVTASAEGRAPWSVAVRVHGEGKTERVEVPVLPPVAAPTPSPRPSATSIPTAAPSALPPPASTLQRDLTWAVGGVGVIAIGVGSYFGLRSASKRDDAQPHCTGDACDPTGIALRDQAISAGDASTIFFVAGGALVAGAVVLIFTSPRATSPRVAASIGPARATVGIAW